MSDTDTDTAVQDAQDEFYLYNVEGKTVERDRIRRIL
jgi:hypothetical protein